MSEEDKLTNIHPLDVYHMMCRNYNDFQSCNKRVDHKQLVHGFVINNELTTVFILWPESINMAIYMVIIMSVSYVIILNWYSIDCSYTAKSYLTVYSKNGYVQIDSETRENVLLYCKKPGVQSSNTIRVR